MRRLQPVALLAFSLLFACAHPRPRPGRTAPGVVLDPEDQTAQRIALPPGTQLLLSPVQISNTKRNTLARSVWNGWWRAAMQQSARFDIAAHTDGIAPSHQIRLHVDAQAQAYTTTLRRDGLAPLPLAAVRHSSQPRALDRLAYLTRIALGEELRMAPVPCAAAYSKIPGCIQRTEAGLDRQRRGDFGAAFQKFEEARSFDGGCARTLMHLAAARANRSGDAEAQAAMRTASEALKFKNRLTPRTEHRLARILLVVRRDDQRLLELGTAYSNDRPHDPHGPYTVALAHNKLGSYNQSLPLLRKLQLRWPKNALVQYQLSFAQLATNQPEDALESLEAVRSKLGQQSIARPFAMALYHAGKHDELQRFLAKLRRSRGVAVGQAEIEVVRMQASHALLRKDNKTAKKHLAQSLALVRERVSELGRYTMIAAEDGEVLARIGASTELRHALDGFYQLGRIPPAFRLALVYLEGLYKVSKNRDPARELQDLEKAKDTTWHNQLLAARHHRRGELSDETAALERAVTSSSHPLIHAHAARALHAAGQHDAAAKIALHIRDRLLNFDQRKPREHPLMSPGRALAFLVSDARYPRG